MLGLPKPGSASKEPFLGEKRMKSDSRDVVHSQNDERKPTQSAAQNRRVEHFPSVSEIQTGKLELVVFGRYDGRSYKDGYRIAREARPFPDSLTVDPIHTRMMMKLAI